MRGLVYAPEMRAILIPLLLAVTPANAGSLTKPEFVDLIAPVEEQADAMKRLVEQMGKGPFRSLVAISDGRIREALERSEAARTAFLPKLSDYARAMDDAAYQLRVCAR